MTALQWLLLGGYTLAIFAGGFVIGLLVESHCREFYRAQRRINPDEWGE